MSIREVQGPASEPITLNEAKLHLRESENDQDALVLTLIKAARRYAENYTRRVFVERTMELTLDHWPAGHIISVPTPPLQSVSWIKYIDFAGNLQTLDSSLYVVDAYQEPARIQPAYLETWPDIRGGDFNSIQVRYVAGYASGSPSDYRTGLPEELKAWMKTRVADLYENRESVSIGAGNLVQVPRHTIDGLLDGLIVSIF